MAWVKILPMIKKGLSHGQGDATSHEHIRKCLLSGDMILVAAHIDGDIRAGMIIEIEQRPCNRVLFVVLLAGERMNEWLDKMEQSLIAIAKTNYVDCIETSCRDGLVRILTKRGWSKKATIMECPLCLH